jgi:hypothetical protein
MHTQLATDSTGVFFNANGVITITIDRRLLMFFTNNSEAPTLLLANYENKTIPKYSYYPYAHGRYHLWKLDSRIRGYKDTTWI